MSHVWSKADGARNRAVQLSAEMTFDISPPSAIRKLADLCLAEKGFASEGVSEMKERLSADREKEIRRWLQPDKDYGLRYRFNHEIVEVLLAEVDALRAESEAKSHALEGDTSGMEACGGTGVD